MDSQTGNRGSLLRTIKNRAEECSVKCALLYEVHIIWDLWSIGSIGPGLEPRVRHGSSAYEEGGDSVEPAGPKVGRGFGSEGDAAWFGGGGVTAGYKNSQAKSIELWCCG